MSSVRGWLLYKSALDLWDDVSDQNTLKNSTVTRTLSTRQSSSNNHNGNGNTNVSQNDPVGTLGRFGSSDMLKPTPIAVDKASSQLNNRITVKRTKSLWKFKRSHKNEILEGMSLWKHRSLIDVRNPDSKENQNQSDQMSTNEEKTENIYASAENLLIKDNTNQKSIDKINNEKNTRKNVKNESGKDQEDYYSDDTTILDDDSDSVIVVNDHINLTTKRKNRTKYVEISNRSNMSQSGTLRDNGDKYNEMSSNSRSDLSEQTETETIGKESFLPRMKLIKSSSNDISNNHFIERDLSNRKPYSTWNPNLKIKESKKWRENDGKTTNFYREKSNNKLKDAPKLIKDQLRVNESKTKCGPWYDLWGVDSSVKS